MKPKKKAGQPKTDPSPHPGSGPAAPEPAGARSTPQRSTLAMIGAWFLSRTLRHARHMRRHVRKLINEQRDLLGPHQIEAVQAAAEQLRSVGRQGGDRQALQQAMDHLEKVANKHLLAHPHPGWRENVEVLLVAIAVAMGIRTFFLQPFKIPTGSMQPTLFGITDEDLRDQPEARIPSRLNPKRLFDFWFNGVGYVSVTAKTDGRIEIVDETPSRFLLFNWKQRFRIGGVLHTVWFPPENLWVRAGFLTERGHPVSRYAKRGEEVIKLKVISGDHLFVDRFTYNFRRPRRGEIIVFETKDIQGLPPNQFYIKRLVALGGERVRVGNDQHLIINGRRLNASDPHFELVYSFNGPAQKDRYSGHVNGQVVGLNAGLFPDESAEYQVKNDHYMVMGDNTMNSYDSRAWGDFPREKVIGKAYFVYWPIGTVQGRAGRFGWAPR